MNDLKFACRQLAKSPGFTAVAVLTLALGIGANTAIFSVVDAVLIRPLPYPDPEKLVRLTWQYQRSQSESLTANQFKFLSEHNRAFQASAGYRGGGDLELKTGKLTEWATALRVSTDFFQVLGVNPALGRSFLAEEARAGDSAALVLSHGLWERVFGGDREIIGRQVTLNGGSGTVVGVLPAGFTFAQPAEVFTPLRLGDTVEDKGMNTSVIARLRPGLGLLRAQAETGVLFDQYRKAYGGEPGEQGARLVPYQEWLVGNVRPSLLLLFGAVGLLLLIACANVANLLMARATARQREISIRLALGARRMHLLWQFLSESLVLGVAGGAAGLLSAVWLVKALTGLIPSRLLLMGPINLDVRVVLFTLLMAVGSSVVFGLTSFMPALKADCHATLKERGTVAGYGATRSRLRSLLLIGEMALSVMLLVGAGLLIQSLYRLYQEKLGFNPRNLITMRTPLAQAKYPTTASVWNLERQALERLEAVPGARSAAVVSVLPLGGLNNLPAQRAGHTEDSIGGMEYRAISPGYFRTMEIPMLRGRGFVAGDSAAAAPVAMVNETLARRWWPRGNPIGDHVVIGMYQGTRFPDILEPAREIVGVVGDVKGMQLNQPAPPTIYVPAAQIVHGPSDATAWVVRTSGSQSLDFIATLRAAIAGLDPDQRVESIGPMSEVIGRSVAGPKSTALLMGTFAGLALMLAAVGLYGVISYTATQRTHEIGLRMALGARQRDVSRLVLGEGLRLALVGAGIGLAAALALTRILRSKPVGIEPIDPVTLLAVSLLLTGVALFASYIPARRAAKVDPMEALRCE